MANYEIKLLDIKADERQALGARFLRDIRDARSGMDQMFDKQERWDKFYENNLPPKTFPWEDCSNVNVPLIQSQVDTFVAHVSDVVLSVSPVTMVQPPAELASDPNVKDIASKVENLLNTIETQRMDLPSVLSDQLIPAALRTPAGIAKVAWREDYRQVKRIVQGMEPVIDPLTQSPAIDGTGMPVMQPVEQVVEQQEVAYAGPKPEFVDLKDFVVYPLTAKSIDDATLVGHKYRLTADKVKRRAADGYFYPDSTAVLDSLESEASVEDQRDDDTLEYEGLDKLSGFDAVYLWEIIAPYDANKDGIEEDCLFTLEAKTGHIVRATEYPYFHGRRCYVKAVPYPRPGRFFGRCIPQILEGCQAELNALHNQRIDSTTIAATKLFKLLRSSNLDHDNLGISPGKAIPVDSMDELQEFTISPLIPGIEYEDRAQMWAERATGANDVAQGKTTEADKTLGEVQLAASQSGIRFGDIIRRVQSSVIEIGKQVIGLCYQFMTPEELMSFGLERQHLEIDWVLVPHGNTGTANKMQQRNEAVTLYDRLMQNPLVQSNPMYVHRLSRELLMAFDREDYEQFIGTAEELQMQIQQAQMMAAEQQAMMQGQAEQQMAMQQGSEQQKMMLDQANRDADREQQMAIAKMNAESRRAGQNKRPK